MYRLRPGHRRSRRAALKRVELTGEREIDRFESVAARVRRLAPEVVRGSGWVAGGDGRRDEIEAGEAVLWDAGEEHESGSDDGMTALVVEAEAVSTV